MRSIKLLLFLLLLTSITSCQKFDFDKTTTYMTSAEIDSIRTRAAFLRNEGRKNREKSQFSEALTYQTQALELSLRLKDTVTIAEDYNQLGTTFRRLGRSENALHNHYLALGYSENYHDQVSNEAIKNLVVSCNGLGNVHLSLGNYDVAESYFRRSLAGEEKLNSILGKAINYANIGSIFDNRNQLDSAFWYYQQSMKMNQELGSDVGMSLCLVYFGKYYEKLDSLQKAEEEFREAVKVINNNEDRWHAFESLEALSRNLIKQNRIAEAEVYANEILTIATDLHSFEKLQDAYAVRAEISERKGNLKDALYEFKQSSAWGDSIVSPENNRVLNEIFLDYELNNNRNQILNLKQAYAANDRMHKAVAWIEFALLFLSIIIIALMKYAAKNRKLKIAAWDKLENMRTIFFRNLTHEFRTPLTVIMGLAEQLKTEEISKPQQVHLLNSIVQQGNSLINLVNELLGLSKMVSGFEQCEWRHGDIVSYLRMTVTGYTDYARMRNIELRFNTTMNQIDMDFVPDYYQKIVNNLIGNAFKHTPSGGSITLSVDLKSGHLMLDVLDTGEGISVEDMPHIFEMFYQGHSSGKQASTGIGLPYVQQMVRQMGGIITAENNLPRGTAIHIVMSIVCNNENVTEIKPWKLEDSLHNIASNNQIVEEENVEDTDTSRPLVMIVEDNPDISDYISLLLHSRYRVVKASDAYDALRKMSTTIPDIILTDLMMPGMDGYELCHTIRNSLTHSDIPIIIISARDEESDKTKGLEDGANAYLIKPFNPAELHETISNLLNECKFQREKISSLINELQTQSTATYVANQVEGNGIETDNPDAIVFIRDFINAVYNQMPKGTPQIEDIANSLEISKQTLIKITQEKIHTNPAAFMMQLRLQKSTQMLKKTQLTLNEIAISCGFEDLNSFNRIFRYFYHQTPSQYRVSSNNRNK